MLRFAIGYPFLTLAGDWLFQHGTEWTLLLAGLSVWVVIWGLAFDVVGPMMLRFPLLSIDAPQRLIDYPAEHVDNNRWRMAAIFFIGDVIPFGVCDYLFSWHWKAQMAQTQRRALSRPPGF